MLGRLCWGVLPVTRTSTPADKDKTASSLSRVYVFLMPRHVAFLGMSSCSSRLLSCLSLSLDIAVAPRAHVTKDRWIQVQTGLAGFAERYFR